MPEYIDREKYCAEVCRCNKEKCDKSKCPVWNAPAADVAPVVHAKWIGCENKIGTYQCSNCGINIWGAESHYCPYCGAKMDLEDDE